MCLTNDDVITGGEWGFEPSVRLRVQRFSRPSRSTTTATLHLPRCLHNQICATGTRAGHIKISLEMQSKMRPFHNLVDFALFPYPMFKPIACLRVKDGRFKM